MNDLRLVVFELRCRPCFPKVYWLLAAVQIHYQTIESWTLPYDDSNFSKS